MASATAKQTAAPAAVRSHLPWIIGFAVVARVLYTVLYFRSTPLSSLTNWGYENVSIALAILAGRGYSSPFFFPSGPTAFMPPGYPLLIAGVYAHFGHGRRGCRRAHRVSTSVVCHH